MTSLVAAVTCEYDSGDLGYLAGYKGGGRAQGKKYFRLELLLLPCATFTLVYLFQSLYKDCAGNGGLRIWTWDRKTSPKKGAPGQVLRQSYSLCRKEALRNSLLNVGALSKTTERRSSNILPLTGGS